MLLRCRVLTERDIAGEQTTNAETLQKQGLTFEKREDLSLPVGKALLGHKRGDIVTVALPSGKSRKLKITKIDVA